MHQQTTGYKNLKEQRSNDATWIEINLRRDIANAPNSRVACTEELNREVAKQIYDLSQQDQYFKESTVTEESIQCIGHMETARQNFDLLDSVDSVILLFAQLAVLFFVCLLCYTSGTTTKYGVLLPNPEGIRDIYI